ncbi:hypothetical protein F511_38526 [Dorcoceras hygrometricum]|uniref:Uncharacterized protein n=1 Tax=Dorcoceras hygrometricum TaxID=472368 RepID=A0A2Z7CTA4_9LAMI|nr:hypothetical protein F511_38526 [Dorcoceras hygrometricum]
MARMFRTLESSGLRGFLGVSRSMYEEALTQLSEGASVIDGKAVSAMEGKQVIITKELFIETFGMPTEGITSFGNLPPTVVEKMKVLFSLSGIPFKPSSKKKEMKVEYSLLKDIVAKSLTAKVGSFDAITTEQFESQGYILQIGKLLETFTGVDLGESMALHPLKVLNAKSAHTYKI